MASASAPTDGCVCTSTTPAWVPAPAWSPRCARRWSTGRPGAGMRAATRRLTSSSSAPDRRQVVSATTGAGPRPCREPVGELQQPGAPRRRGRRRWPGRGRRRRRGRGRRRRAPAAAAPAPGRCPGTRRRTPRGSARAGPPRRPGCSASSTGAVHQLGVVQGALRVEHVEVLPEEAGQRRPVVAAHPGCEGTELVRVEADLAGPRQQRAHLLGQARVVRAARRVGGQRRPRSSEPRSRSRSATSCSGPDSSRSGSV